MLDSFSDNDEPRLVYIRVCRQILIKVEVIFSSSCLDRSELIRLELLSISSQGSESLYNS